MFSWANNERYFHFNFDVVVIEGDQAIDDAAIESMKNRSTKVQFSLSLFDKKR